MNTRVPSFAVVNPKPDMACIIHGDMQQVLQPAQKHSLRAQIQRTEIMEVLSGARAGAHLILAQIQAVKTKKKADISPGRGSVVA